MNRLRSWLNRSSIFGVVTASVAAILLTLTVSSMSAAAGLAAATYAKTTAYAFKRLSGETQRYLVTFTITGGAGDTYTTNGVTPVVTSMGYTAIDEWLGCVDVDGYNSIWTGSALKLYEPQRTFGTELYNATTLNTLVFRCSAIVH